MRNVADMFASFVTYNQTSGMYSTLNETSPDEYRCVSFRFGVCLLRN